MAELKTKVTTKNPNDFLNTVEPEQKKKDAFSLLSMFEKITGEKPVMWGDAMIGFGKYHYKSQKSSQEGDWFLTGFSPRKQNLTMYIMHGNETNPDIAKLGKYKTGMGCLYINKLSDVDLELLTKIIKTSFDHMKKVNNIK